MPALLDFSGQIAGYIAERCGLTVHIDRRKIGSGQLYFYFGDLHASESLIFGITTSGLKRLRLTIELGDFGTPLLTWLVSQNEVALNTVEDTFKRLSTCPQVSKLDPFKFSDWTGERKLIEYKFGGQLGQISWSEIQGFLDQLVVPVTSTFADLFASTSDVEGLDSGIMEGALSVTEVKRRERSRLNRALSIEAHGYRCFICGLDPMSRYGDGGQILEVHHLTQLGNLDDAMIFDPVRDLIPLCPNCHAAVHTRRPIPWKPTDIEIKDDE
ncbi:hypothetical protein OAQ35_05095 [Litorivicinus sp.]|nr:hypothetical protein [Litorivicinus sp.]